MVRSWTFSKADVDPYTTENYDIPRGHYCKQCTFRKECEVWYLSTAAKRAITTCDHWEGINENELLWDVK